MESRQVHTFVLLLMAFATSADCGSLAAHELEVFRKIVLPGTLTSCRTLLQLRAQSLLDCLMRWMQLQTQAPVPGFVRYASPDEAAGGCEISSWCEQLLANESDPQTTLLPMPRGQPRIVLFAVKSGSQVKALDSFLKSAGCNQSLLVSPAFGSPPHDFWRSCWLDRLPELARLLTGKTLSVEILKDNATVLKISFDASFAGLNLQNWFSQARLVSSAPDLALAGRSYNAFSIVGSSSLGSGSYHNRTFFVNTGFASCSGDSGILAVVERHDICAWGMTGNGSAPLPRIVLNPGAGVWNNHAVLADYLLVTAA